MSADLVVQHRLGGCHDRRQLGVAGRVGAELQEGRLQEGDQARPGGWEGHQWKVGAFGEGLGRQVTLVQDNGGEVR